MTRKEPPAMDAPRQTTKAVAEMDYAAENAWIYQQRVRYRTYDDIVAQAQLPPIRDEFGRFDPAGGLGKKLARSTVHARVKSVMGEQAEELKDLAAEYRAASLARLDELAATSVSQIERQRFPLANAAIMHTMDPHAEQVVTRAVTNILRIEERRAKLLGLDAPIEAHVEHIHYDGAALELAAILDDAAGEAPPKKRKKAKA